jgi:CRISPR-associated protein Csb2
LLALEIEYLAGASVAASDQDKTHADWPPQPDRVFSALVASWGARGSRDDERKALEWLERQDPPRIVRSEAHARTTAISFVPPNDFKTSSDGSFDVLPSRRRRQERYFPTTRPENSVVKLVWRAEPEKGVLSALEALAHDTSYVGHSTSLTRCHFTEEPIDLRAGQAALRTVYPGRLADLERWFKSGQRPSPGEVVLAASYTEAAPATGSVFSRDWVVLAHAGGLRPDLLAAPLLARTIRDALMDAYTDLYHAIAPEWLSGHSADGKPSPELHAAFVPLANVGAERSDGDLKGFAIVLPRTVTVDNLYALIGNLLNRNKNTGHIALRSPQRGLVESWIVKPTTSDETMFSLQSYRWVKKSRLWATVTPVVLDRYPKKTNIDDRATEIADCVKSACKNIGLANPSYVGVHTNSCVSGAPPAFVPRGARSWQRWQVPSSLEHRYLTHAVLGFDEPVQGPIILGAGRFAGLGLCLPIAKEGRG